MAENTLGSVGIVGLEAFIKELEVLPEKLKRDAIDKAVMAGSRVVKTAALKNAPTRRDLPEELWKGFGLKGRPGFLANKGIIIRKPYGRWKSGWSNQARVIGFSKAAFYGKFIERGWDWTFPPGKKKGGRVLKRIVARPFLRPALLDNKDRIVSQMTKIMKKRVAMYRKG